MAIAPDQIAVMHALTSKQPVLKQLARDLRECGKLDHLEPSEAVQFAEEGQDDLLTLAIHALANLENKSHDRMNRLLTDLMGDVTADKLVDFRDLLRSSITDEALRQIKRILQA